MYLGNKETVCLIIQRLIPIGAAETNKYPEITLDELRNSEWLEQDAQDRYPSEAGTAQRRDGSNSRREKWCMDAPFTKPRMQRGRIAILCNLFHNVEKSVWNRFSRQPEGRGSG